METIIKDQITAKGQLEIWAIRTYLHRRIYNILVPLTKIAATYFLLTGINTSIFLVVNSIFLFFYFELYILYRYIDLKKRIKAIYGNDRESVMELKQDEINFKSKYEQDIIRWDDISRVEEKKWFFLIYKENVVIKSIYIRSKPQKDLFSIKGYFKEQFKLGREVHLRKQTEFLDI